MSDVVSDIKRAKAASIELSVLSTEVKDRALGAMAQALDSSREQILEANARDLEAAKAMLDSGEISGSMYKRLKIDGSKIDGMIAGINDVIGLTDPVGEQMSALDLDDGLTLYQIRCPIGMLGMIFESRPDVVPQIMSLCLKSGNAVAFKGGREAANSIRVLFTILRDAASAAGVPADAFVLLETRADINVILDLDRYIDLLIPRGSNEFVRYIQENTRIPVLGHAAGVCHVYVDEFADPDMAETVALDSKVQYPAVCNATETLLVNSRIADTFVPRMVSVYEANGVEVRGDEKVCSLTDAIPATSEDWDTEYGDLIISIKVVDSLSEAIDFINQTGDLKLDINLELRSFLFWKFYGAVFVDAGNIWTLREYEEQPGGQFRFSDFYKQIAVAYGLGLRLDLDFFVLRLDGGMKAINPVYESGRLRYPIIHPNFKRDFAFHFAVGYPF